MLGMQFCFILWRTHNQRILIVSTLIVVVINPVPDCKWFTLFVQSNHVTSNLVRPSSVHGVVTCSIFACAGAYTASDNALHGKGSDHMRLIPTMTYFQLFVNKQNNRPSSYCMWYLPSGYHICLWNWKHRELLRMMC